ncbi:MAG: TGS domain-containing protein [Paludibacteraceae bacterium]|nr:TGS domain-containing protein [Paludibacteraceae bacterium]
MKLGVAFDEKKELVLQSWLDRLPEAERQARMDTIDIVIHEISLGQTAATAIVLSDYDFDHDSATDPRPDNYADLLHEVKTILQEDKQVEVIVRGLQRVARLYEKNMSLETENFRKLLLALAEDVRVVLIIIAERAALMRRLNTRHGLLADAAKEAGLPVPDFDDEAKHVAKETSFLYAPLAHRLGLYQIKTELEDLALKFSNYSMYKEIAHALNEKKQQRDAYIASFIGPVDQKLKALGLHYHIKGRTKSIHSIYNKMQKQNCGVDGIYDLFAIRIILDSAPEKEKAECWQVYSVVADMYQPNPKRLRDWLSIPKSNGYESLHTTVLGPEQKWVEVQIRTERMDEVAEKGVAAHWKYKGGKAENNGMDAFLKGVREMLESDQVDTREAIDEFKMNLYDEEVFVFTPNGDLHKLCKGATVLDFAFAIHSGLGCKCMGGKIAGRNVPIKYVLKNGDQVEILTSATQRPTEAWLKIVKTSKAKNKIRQSLKEIQYKDALDGRELFERRFKNWKLEADEGKVSHLAKKMGYKVVSDFYQAIAQGRIDMIAVRDVFEQLEKASQEAMTQTVTTSAQNFVNLQNEDQTRAQHDELVIDRNLKNVDYKLAKCCNPIYGDPIYGFVSVSSGIKIHRQDCPNAADMRDRYPYRIMAARWSGKAVGTQYPITLSVVGQDDIGIVSGLTSLLNKESGVLLRSISIDSHDGLFEGQLTLMVSSIEQLDAVQRKMMTIRGVKSITRR